MSCLLRHITASKNFRKNEPNDIWKPEPSHDRKEFRWETSKRMNTDRAVEPAIRSAGTAIFLWSSSLAIANFFFRQIISATFFSSILPRVIQAVSPPSNQSHNSCCGVKSSHVTNLVKRGGRGEFFFFRTSNNFFSLLKHSEPRTGMLMHQNWRDIAAMHLSKFQSKTNYVGFIMIFSFLLIRFTYKSLFYNFK